MLKKTYLYILLAMLLPSMRSFADIGNPSVSTELAEDNNFNKEKDNLDSGEVETENSINTGDIPKKNSDSDSNLLQYNVQDTQEKQDPFPLEKYQGQIISNIDDIKKAFSMKNIEQVKASLDTMYNNNAQNMPLEGYLMLAAIYDQLQCYSKSISILDAGKLLADPERQVVFDFNKAQVLRHFGQYMDAINILDGLDSTYQKTYPEIPFYKGLSYLYLNKADLAVLNLRKYLDLLPKGPQHSNIRRAIAWLILHKTGKIDNGSVDSGSSKEQNLEKMLQLLMEKQINSQVSNLINSTSTNVDNKALDLQSKEIADLEDYSDVVE